MNKELLIKFLNNRCTSKELHEVVEWVKMQTLVEEDRTLVLEDWNSYQEEDKFENSKMFGSLLDRIHHKINIENSKKLKVGEKHRTVSLITVWLTRAAAILLIPVLAFLFYTLSEKNIETNKYASLAVDTLEVIAPIGSRTVVHLSDGSEVYLNYGSKIRYPQFFTGNTREIMLTGEGFFNVAHNPEKPFFVKTGKLNVKALGTAFNVLAYPEDNIVETTLVNGKVVLEQTEVNGFIKTIGTMEPGQHVSINSKSGTVSSAIGSVDRYIAWKDGKQVFEDMSITQVAERLSRMFNVDIEVKDDIKDYIYTVTFMDEPLFQILDLMTIATPISYKALPRKKTPDGTFSKQKIIIQKKEIQ